MNMEELCFGVSTTLLLFTSWKVLKMYGISLTKVIQKATTIIVKVIVYLIVIIVYATMMHSCGNAISTVYNIDPFMTNVGIAIIVATTIGSWLKGEIKRQLHKQDRRPITC